MPNNINQPHSLAWLQQLAERIKPTTKGVRVGLWVYVHPKGNGYLTYVDPVTNTGREEQPLNNIDEACDLFRALWEQATGLASAKAGGDAGAEPTNPTEVG